MTLRKEEIQKQMLSYCTGEYQRHQDFLNAERRYEIEYDHFFGEDLIVMDVDRILSILSSRERNQLNALFAKFVFNKQIVCQRSYYISYLKEKIVVNEGFWIIDEDENLVQVPPYLENHKLPSLEKLINLTYSYSYSKKDSQLGYTFIVDGVSYEDESLYKGLLITFLARYILDYPLNKS